MYIYIMFIVQFNWFFLCKSTKYIFKKDFFYQNVNYVLKYPKIIKINIFNSNKYNETWINLKIIFNNDNIYNMHC